MSWPHLSAQYAGFKLGELSDDAAVNLSDDGDAGVGRTQ
jgi:hypothetical protein